MNADGTGGLTNLTLTSPLHEFEPTWSPDGTQIAYWKQLSDGNLEVFVMNANGSGQTNLTDSPAEDFSAAWSPSSVNKIAFARSWNLNVTVKNVDPAFEAGPNQTLSTGSGVFSRNGIAFTDPGTLDAHTLTVNFGDGSGNQMSILTPTGVRLFDLNHTYTTSGTFTVDVKVEDDDGGTFMDTFYVTAL
jgi:hypothetical protein